LDLYYHHTCKDDGNNKYGESAFPIHNSFTLDLPDSPGLVDATLEVPSTKTPHWMPSCLKKGAEHENTVFSCSTCVTIVWPGSLIRVGKNEAYNTHLQDGRYCQNKKDPLNTVLPKWEETLLTAPKSVDGSGTDTGGG
jgi:hypothetical protein